MIEFNNKSGFLCFDQIKTIDKNRITKRLGSLDAGMRRYANEMLYTLFSEE